jgi:tetratricopeptide (TPR) repeat protein
MTGEAGCDDVARYLDRFAKATARAAPSLEAVAEHVRSCGGCYERMSRFFRTMELPPATFLKETLDELCGAMYQLAVGVLRERVDPEVSTENVVSVYTKGSAKDAAADGRDMLNDAEDFAGEPTVGDVALDDVRGLLDRAEMSKEKKLDMARLLCEQIVRFDSRHTAVACNLLGVIHHWQGRHDEAERAYLRTLAAPVRETSDRSFKAFAHCNLAYVSGERGDFKAAAASARRSIAVAQEIDENPFFGEFALVYFLVKIGPSGETEARETLRALLARPDGAKRFVDALRMENNRGVAATLRESFVGREHPELVSAPV